MDFLDISTTSALDDSTLTIRAQQTAFHRSYYDFEAVDTIKKLYEKKLEKENEHHEALKSLMYDLRFEN